MSGRNYLKTTLLLATMSGLLLLVGQLLGGGRWLTIMLLVAIGINGLSYFFSDKIALRASRAQPVTEAQFPELYHVRNRDILISSVAATIGAVITWVAHLAWFLPIGGDDDDGNAIGSLLMLLLAPIAAMLIQLAVTRSREFGADASGANITADPLALASALRKIEAYSRGTPPANTNPSTAHLFISNPFKSGGGGFAMASLFSTHPPTSERVARLEAMAYGPRRYA